LGVGIEGGAFPTGTKVCFFTHDLSQGGTQEMVKRLAEGLSRMGYSVSMVCQVGDAQTARPLSADIGFDVLHTQRVVASVFPLARYFARTKPDVIIAALSHNNLGAILAYLVSFHRCRLILTEHAPLSRLIAFYEGWRYRILPAAIALLYPLADAVVAVSRGVADDLGRVVPKLRNLRVIFNPIVAETLPVTAEASFPWSGVPIIVAAGRLVLEKDFSFLLRAFARLRRDRDVRLAILGEGPERANLERQIGELGLQADVALLGWQPNPYAYFHRAAVLAATSRFEGFGNVIAEALACGIPVVSTDCPVGPVEILDHGRFGTLTEIGDEEGFAMALARAIDDPGDPEQLKQRAAEYSVTASVASYDRLIQSLLAHKGTAAAGSPGCPRRLRIGIYMNDLSGGGVERMRLRLIKALREKGIEVTLLLHSTRGDLHSFLPDDLRVIEFNTSRTLYDLIPLWRYLRRERPDVLMSSLDHNNIIAALACGLSGTNAASVVSQHNSLSDEARELGFKYRVVPQFYRLFKRFMRQVVCVSQGVADDLVATCGISRDVVNVIYNPIIDNDFFMRSREEVVHPWFGNPEVPVFVTAGRLVLQKDHETLLKAFALLLQKRRARLLILGTGPRREILEAMANSLGIREAVDFLGFQPNPLPFFRQADAFVLSSRHEGLGNVIVEALACGTPVISTDCPHGPAEILENGKNGILVPVGDPGALADAMASDRWRKWTTEELIASTNRFHIDDIAEQYVACIERARRTAGNSLTIRATDG
jgi:glycosyltransferase involved in cell wall biosynthesis